MKRQVMIGLLGIAAAGVLLTFAASAGGSDASGCSKGPVADTVRLCAGCHSGSQSLADSDTEELAAVIRAMRDGKVRHPSPLPKLSDEEVDALAAALTCD